MGDIDEVDKLLEEAYDGPKVIAIPVKKTKCPESILLLGVSCRVPVVTLHLFFFLPPFLRFINQGPTLDKLAA